MNIEKATLDFYYGLQNDYRLQKYILDFSYGLKATTIIIIIIIIIIITVFTWH